MGIHPLGPKKKLSRYGEAVSGRAIPGAAGRGFRAPGLTGSGHQWAVGPAGEIAALVARGYSTSEIARGMLLSRRTVQTYISHILARLGAKSRVAIVREALRQGIAP